MIHALLYILLHPGAILPLLLIPVAGTMSARQGPHSRKWDGLLLAAIFVHPALILCNTANIWLAHHIPLKYDQYIFCIDNQLGLHGFALARIADASPAFKWFLSISYNLLGCAAVAIIAAYLWKRPRGEAREVVTAFAINCLLAVPCYLLVPVCGPAYAFRRFPFGAPAHLIPQPMAIIAPPNGVPSVHMSTALITLWFARHWRLGIVIAGIYAALIAMATIGLGEHYVFDLLIAIPYSGVVIGLARKLCRRLPRPRYT